MLNVWEYQDAIGIPRRGVFLDYKEYSGTDVSYRFHRLDDQGKPIVYLNGGRQCDIVSGAKLKAAQRVAGMTLAAYKEATA